MPTIKNPERALAKLMARNMPEDAEELILEGMKGDTEPTAEEATAILLRHFFEGLGDNEEAQGLLAKLGWQSIDRDALDAELWRVVAPAVRVGLKGVRRALAEEASGKAPTRADLEREAQARQDASSLLLALRILERHNPGSLHSIARSWRPSVPEVPKDRFDRAAVDLAKRRKVVLHHHDYPATLSEEERAGLVRDEMGTYYVGAGLP